MKTICAWCRKTLLEDEQESNLISHGICQECRPKLEKELELKGGDKEMDVNTMIDPQKVAQTVYGLAKDYTTANVQVMKTTMEQYEKTMNTLIKQGIVAQDEGTKLWADWWNRAKQGQQQYYNLMDEGLKKMDNLFNNTDGNKRTTK